MAAVSADSTLDDLERRLAELEFLVGERTSTAEPIAVAVKNIETTLGEKAKELRDLYRQCAQPQPAGPPAPKHRHQPPAVPAPPPAPAAAARAAVASLPAARMNLTVPPIRASSSRRRRQAPAHD